MNIKRTAAIVYTIGVAGAVAFQIALAAGAPWGEYAMGGAYPGQFPAELRVAAVAQAAILSLTAAVVLSCAGVALPRWARASRWLIWLVVVLSGASLLMNLATPSGVERMIWAPVAVVLFACSLLVAVGRPSPEQQGPR